MTDLHISESMMAAYRATARQRTAAREQALGEKRQRAHATARAAARLLREQFGAARVVLFGSALRSDAFWEHSDIDLAAWGIPRSDYFLAVAKLQELSAEFSIDLVEGEHCRPALRRAIDEEGTPL